MPSGSEILSALPVVAILIVIEGLLSVDNALAIAGMASHLPRRQQLLALRLGIVGAYVFRGIALWCAAWIIANPWLKLLGAAYLIHLMCRELTKGEASEAERERRHPPGLFQTIVQIELMDLSLSIDNVVAAVALSSKLWVVYTGVFIGILALRFIAGLCIRLIVRFPILGQTAFLLVGFVGVLLVYEIVTHRGVGSLGKFVGVFVIVVSSLVYGGVPVVHKAFEPVVRQGRNLMQGFTRLEDLLTWPVRKLFTS